MKAVGAFVVILLLGSLCSAAEPLGIQDIYGMSQAVPAEVEVSLSLPERINIGDCGVGRFIVKNTGSHSFKVNMDETGPRRLKMRVTNARGQVLPDLNMPERGDGFFLGPRTLEPDQSEAIVCSLQDYVTFSEAGVYTVEAWHDLGWRIQDDKPYPTAKATIEVVMPTPEKAAARVHELCAKNSRQSEGALFVLRHPVYLAALISEVQAGHVAATHGLANIAKEEASEVLITLVKNAEPEMAKAAGHALTFRLPSLTDSAEPAFPYIARRLPVLKCWRQRFDAPLMEAMQRLIAEKDAESVRCAASILEARGGGEEAGMLLGAMQQAIDEDRKPRPDEHSMTMSSFKPLHELIRAADALRKRGWRVDFKASDKAKLLVQYRQLADPKIPRPAEKVWKPLLMNNNMRYESMLLRENAIKAIPLPFGEEWDKDLIYALDDADLGVVRAACELAGKSGRKTFIRPLSHVIEMIHDRLVQSVATEAATKLGARSELWQAWCEVIIDEARTSEAIGTLIKGTIDIPRSNLTDGGVLSISRNDRFVVREAWRGFLAKNHVPLESGKRVPLSDPSVTPVLAGAGLTGWDSGRHFDLGNGKEWPPRRKE